ncbi:MAG: hypothetical protein ACK5Z5_04880 [Neisseriaceae bacterium]
MCALQLASCYQDSKQVQSFNDLLKFIKDYNINIYHHIISTPKSDLQFENPYYLDRRSPFSALQNGYLNDDDL